MLSQVIADIDKMITALREEEKADIEHKDWCEAQQSAANSKNENLECERLPATILDPTFFLQFE